MPKHGQTKFNGEHIILQVGEDNQVTTTNDNRKNREYANHLEHGVLTK
jgi:hypothetical protein